MSTALARFTSIDHKGVGRCRSASNVPCTVMTCLISKAPKSGCRQLRFKASTHFKLVPEIALKCEINFVLRRLQANILSQRTLVHATNLTHYGAICNYASIAPHPIASGVGVSANTRSANPFMRQSTARLTEDPTFHLDLGKRVHAAHHSQGIPH